LDAHRQIVEADLTNPREALEQDGGHPVIVAADSVDDLHTFEDHPNEKFTTPEVRAGGQPEASGDQVIGAHNTFQPQPRTIVPFYIDPPAEALATEAQPVAPQPVTPGAESS